MDWKIKLAQRRERLFLLKHRFAEKAFSPLLLASLILTFSVGCEKTFQKPPLRVFPDMDEQQKVRPQAESVLFEHGQSIQTPVPETVARGELGVGSPMKTEWDIKRGAYVFESYCSPCHGKDGQGMGPVVQKGFIPPPSLITGRTKDWSEVAIYKVIAEGQGTMPSYAHLIDHADRVRIVMYLKKLQGESKP